MKIHVHLIAPYASMLSIVEECVPLFPDLHIECSVGDLENGVELAVAAQRAGADIIVSRGGTARSIKRSVTIPVIDVQLSGYDMIRSLLLASSLKEKTAIVGFPNVTSGAQAIIDLLDLPLKAFTVTEPREVPPLILDLKSRDYKQIAGDVITLKTANEYGLKGFLIQSGRESVRSALEDARLVYGYLHRNDHLVRVFERFLQSAYPNLVVADKKNRIVYARIGDFERNPLTEERLAVLGAKLDQEPAGLSEKLTIDGQALVAEGFRHFVDDKTYTLYTLRKTGNPVSSHKGVTAFYPEDAGPLIEASPEMSRLTSQLRALYREGERVAVYGRKGSGKNFAVDHIHRECSPNGRMMTIDFEQAELSEFSDVLPDGVSTIKLIHASRADSEPLKRFVDNMAERGIRVFVIENASPDPQLLAVVGAVRLAMPTLSERQEDLLPLAQAFLSDCQQKLGTNAVKIQEAAAKLLQNRYYADEIDGLKRLIKELALSETDYVIRAETVHKATNESSAPSPWQMPTGTLKEIEKQVIEAVLREENHNQSRTAERLGINRATLWRKLKE
ncbi:sigma-54-dependent Fis family transcriptional regulator [Saccharibacillus sacchari]|uniref:PrpR N-terminal domain-containing protein n=1 Tax=Saccharibacillus sacchari TaxID=456493 RepID=A0ACC6PGZ0_9BACL